MFCKHKWELLQETTTESKAEQSIRLVGTIPAARDRIDFEMFYEKWLVTTFSCKLCGKLKRMKDKI